MEVLCGPSQTWAPWIRYLIFWVSPTSFLDWIRVRFSWARTAPPTNLEPRPHTQPFHAKTKPTASFRHPQFLENFIKISEELIYDWIQTLILNQKKSQFAICMVSVFLLDISVKLLNWRLWSNLLSYLYVTINIYLYKTIFACFLV